MRLCLRVIFCLLALESCCRCAEIQADFDVVIAGGSTAAFAAAVSAAESGVRVALLEPTDWVGGQLTSSGVPAVDEAWHQLTNDAGDVTIDVARIARTPANISPHLRTMLDAIGCPGKCWVSRFCFEPRSLLKEHLEPLERKLERLTVFRETVVKHADVRDGKIVSLLAIRRHKKTSVTGDGYDVLPSVDLSDWYSAKDTDRFGKEVLKFRGDHMVYIDATEWGELLALTGAPYLLGVEDEDGGLTGDDSIGQSITFGFVQEFHATADATRDSGLPNPKATNLGLGDYRDREKAWDLVWTYRRLRAAEREPTAGDLSLQNWGYYVEKNEGGNDYPFGYLFLDRKAARQQADDQEWIGGVDLRVMAAAEQRAYAWHHWFKNKAPKEIGANRISLSRSVLGASHGLSKLPYIRDTRRSIGLDGFLLQVRDLQPTSSGSLARKFDDRIALGAYPVDIHPMAKKKYPDYIGKNYEVAPFTIPYRALTNDKIDNMLVAGKTMAQSFLANSATRLHPTEWSTGTAAGVAAAMMSKQKLTARDLTTATDELQRLVKQKTPIDWTLAK